MRPFLLDSDHCIRWLKGNARVRQKVEENGGLKNMRMTLATVSEVFHGAYILPDHPKSGIQATQRFFHRVGIHPFDYKTAKEFGAFRSKIGEFNSKDNFDLMNAFFAEKHGMLVEPLDRWLIKLFRLVSARCPYDPTPQLQTFSVEWRKDFYIDLVYTPMITPRCDWINN